MNPSSPAQITQTFRDEFHTFDLSSSVLPSGLVEISAQVKGIEVNRTLHIPPGSQAHAMQILGMLASRWNSARAHGVAFTMHALQESLFEQRAASLLSPDLGVFRIGRDSLGAPAPYFVVDRRRMFLMQDPGAVVLRPELLGLLRQAVLRNPDFLEPVIEFTSSLPKSFERTGEYFHLARGIGPGALQTIIEELRFTPPIDEVFNSFAETVDAHLPRGNVRERIKAALKQRPFVYATIYTTDPFGLESIAVPCRKDLAAALEARGQGRSTRAYRISMPEGISDARAFEPHLLAGGTGASIEEAIFALSANGDLPKLRPAGERNYAGNPSCHLISCETVAQQARRYNSLQGKSSAVLAPASPVLIPSWLRPHMAAPASQDELAVTHDYREVPSSDSSGESYAASTWRWRTRRFEVDSTGYSVQYEVRWHTKVSNFLVEAYPAFVVTRTILKQNEAGDFQALYSQVLLNCDSKSPAIEALRGFEVKPVIDADGSVWIDEKTKKSAHGAIAAMRRATLAPENRTVSQEVVERARFADAINSLVHHPYLPEYDSANMHWIVQSHRLWLISIQKFATRSEPKP